VKLPPVITHDWLAEHGACEDQRKVFAAEWPDGVVLSEQSLYRAAELGLNLGWFADEYLPTPLWAEYERQEPPLWAEYKRQEAPLLAEYKRQEARLWAEYQRQVALLLAEYERQRAPLWAEYQRQEARLLWCIARAALAADAPAREEKER
jgi:hypothetical protein